jgi:hypothetical protein
MIFSGRLFADRSNVEQLTLIAYSLKWELIKGARCAIPLPEMTCSGKFLHRLEGGGKIDVAEADSGLHGFEAFGDKSIETNVLDFDDEAVEFGDQT